jgi:hypothetical protein
MNWSVGSCQQYVEQHAQIWYVNLQPCRFPHQQTSGFHPHHHLPRHCLGRIRTHPSLLADQEIHTFTFLAFAYPEWSGERALRVVSWNVRVVSWNVRNRSSLTHEKYGFVSRRHKRKLSPLGPPSFCMKCSIPGKSIILQLLVAS